MDDARAFGLVDTDPDGRVLRVPREAGGPGSGDVNAGTYLLDPERPGAVVAEGEAASIELDIFPRVIEAGRAVFGFASDAYWLDLGTPEKYLQAHFDMLEGKVHDVSYPAPWVDPTADVDLRAHLGRWVAVGPGASVAAESRLTIR